MSAEMSRANPGYLCVMWATTSYLGLSTIPSIQDKSCHGWDSYLNSALMDDGDASNGAIEGHQGKSLNWDGVLSAVPASSARTQSTLSVCTGNAVEKI